MSTQRTTLGTCPVCNVQIPSSQLLIRYETSEGWPAMYAECPDCGDVVHPE